MGNGNVVHNEKLLHFPYYFQRSSVIEVSNRISFKYRVNPLSAEFKNGLFQF